ncbi:MAG: sulfite oxidase [Verrucomicrobiales bacterium]|jgi:DMSO/TMAO reductase YedYZ molybdopterin-dependent catalytic subunit|nr:sulfite oxidase [Verrucomicrobiales bacterium]
MKDTSTHLSLKNIPHSETVSSGGMIIREKEPLNLEMHFGSLAGLITPVEKFFVRSHFAVPNIDIETWRLEIEGDVENPLELTFEELKGMETHTLPVTLECAGNGRAFLSPQVKGAQWEDGAVGNAEWTGVKLADLLVRAGVKEGVCEVILEGADEGEIDELPRPAGKIHFSRSLPLTKATDDVLLALQMNGGELTPHHGYPLRAVVPGWYGVASVKWLTRIVVSKVPYHGYYQTIDYAYWERGLTVPSLLPITRMSVKAQISRPEFFESINAGHPYRVHGAAWTSEAEITRVELSTDGGATWNETQLLGDPLPNVWRQWEYQWHVPSTPGRAVLMARATDSEGRSQPEKHHADRGGYLIHHWLPIEVNICEESP